MSAEALRPCPSCGKAGEVYESDKVSSRRWFARHAAESEWCPISFYVREHTREAAVAAWNARPGEDRAREEGRRSGIEDAATRLDRLAAEAWRTVKTIGGSYGQREEGWEQELWEAEAQAMSYETAAKAIRALLVAPAANGEPASAVDAPAEDVPIDAKDLKVETVRIGGGAMGGGGDGVRFHVRVCHVPTGRVVTASAETATRARAEAIRGLRELLRDGTADTSKGGEGGT